MIGYLFLHTGLREDGGTTIDILRSSSVNMGSVDSSLVYVRTIVSYVLLLSSSQRLTSQHLTPHSGTYHAHHEPEAVVRPRTTSRRRGAAPRRAAGGRFLTYIYASQIYSKCASNPLVLSSCRRGAGCLRMLPGMLCIEGQNDDQ